MFAARYIKHGKEVSKIRKRIRGAGITACELPNLLHRKSENTIGKAGACDAASEKTTWFRRIAAAVRILAIKYKSPI
jgi:hypothetical protein